MDRGRILTGLVLIALGALLAGQFDLVEAGPVIATWWSAAVVVAGLLRLFERPPDVTGAAIVLAVEATVVLGGIELATDPRHRARPAAG